MQQLGGLDNLMIEDELPNIPMHMSAVMVYDTDGNRGADRLQEAFHDNVEAMDSRFPILRCKLDPVALDIIDDIHPTLILWLGGWLARSWRQVRRL